MNSPERVVEGINNIRKPDDYSSVRVSRSVWILSGFAYMDHLNSFGNGLKDVWFFRSPRGNLYINSALRTDWLVRFCERILWLFGKRSLSLSEADRRKVRQIIMATLAGGDREIELEVSRYTELHPRDKTGELPVLPATAFCNTMQPEQPDIGRGIPC